MMAVCMIFMVFDIPGRMVVLWTGASVMPLLVVIAAVLQAVREKNMRNMRQEAARRAEREYMQPPTS
jgi:hypothetical protein